MKSRRKKKKLKKKSCQQKPIVTDVASPLFDAFHYAVTCKNKNSYETEWQAKFVADEQYEYNKVILHLYRCPYCQKFHLSSKEN